MDIHSEASLYAGLIDVVVCLQRGPLAHTRRLLARLCLCPTPSGPSPGVEYSAVLSEFANDPVKAVSVLAQWTLGDVERGIVQVPRTATGAILRAGDEPGRRLSTCAVY